MMAEGSRNKHGAPSPDVFISYVEEDGEIARQIADALEREGFPTWCYERDSVAGRPYPERIDHAIQQSRAVIALLSRVSLRSTHVANELIHASEYNKSFVPVLLDLTHSEFQQLRPDLALVLGGATSIRLSVPGIPAGVVRIVDGLMALGIRPRRPSTGHSADSAGVPLPRRAYLLGLIIGLVAIVAVVILILRQGSLTTTGELEAQRRAFLADMLTLRWIVYDPSEYDPYDKKMPAEAGIRQDLEVLWSHGFDGLITMTVKGKFSEIPRIARETKFKGVIAGVWEVREQEEIKNALATAPFVDAYSLGHKGLNKLYTLEELGQTMDAIRQETRRPVTTTEVIADYEANPALLDLGDFLFPDVHTYWHRGQSPQETWRETVRLARRMAELAARVKKVALLKMVSFPSGGGEGLSPETQLEFYRLAVEEARDRTDVPGSVAFAFLGAFDPVWKKREFGWQDAERYTGLFTVDRQPKPAVTQVNWARH